MFREAKQADSSTFNYNYESPIVRNNAKLIVAELITKAMCFGKGAKKC
jgi:hypothetical protein